MHFAFEKKQKHIISQYFTKKQRVLSSKNKAFSEN